MLIKLLKYEFKFTGRSLLPIYAALLVLTVLMNLGDGMRLSFNNVGMFEGFFQTLLIFAYSCVISAVCIITVVLLVQWFYKNLLRDEGYLMHTLPVSAGQNIAAKLICAVVWSVISLLVAGLSLMLISMEWPNWQLFFDGLADFVHDLNVAFGIHWPLFALEALVLVLFNLANSIVKVYLALAIGHIPNNHKIACSVGAYIGLEVFSALLGQLLGRGIVNWHWLGEFFQQFFYGSLHEQIAGIHIMLLSMLAIMLIYTGVLFIATNWIMKNKLNLE